MEYNLKVDFKNKTILPKGTVKLVQNDYNSTTLNFVFDEQYLEHTKVFEMKYPNGQKYIAEMVDNKVVLGLINVDGTDYPMLQQEGKYQYEISCVGLDSKITNYAIGEFEVRKELVNIDDEEIELTDQYPILDQLINDINIAINEANTLNIEANKENGITTISITKKDGTSQETEVLDGVGISNITEESSNEDDGINQITVTMTDELTYQLTTKNGSKGSQGNQGDKGYTGEAGRDALINGKNTITMIAGDNIELEQQDNVLTINAIGGGSIGDVKVNGTSVVEDKIANIDVPTKTSDLTNDSNYAKTNENNNFSAGQTVNGTLTVNGDIVQNGQAYETYAEHLFTKNDVIKTRDGAVGGLAENEYTGIEAHNYDGEHDGQLVFGADGTARVGDKNDTQPLLTREEASSLTDGEVFVWDSANSRAKGSSDFVKNTDYPTSAKAGVVKASSTYGTAVSSSGILFLFQATNADIDTKTNVYRPITSNNLPYGVRSVLPLTSNTLPNPFVPQIEYYLGIVSQVTMVPPETAELSQYSLICFTAGENISVTIDNSIIGDIDYEFVTGNTYEILLTYNGTDWVMQVLEY